MQFVFVVNKELMLPLTPTQLEINYNLWTNNTYWKPNCKAEVMLSSKTSQLVCHTSALLA